jgi:hypothetical protein
MSAPGPKRFQFTLASLFAVTLAVGVLLWAWRFGALRLTFVLAVLPAAILVPIYLVLIGQSVFRRYMNRRDST